MDAFLVKLGAQAMNMAIRSGITITSAYAIQQYGRLVATAEDNPVVDELKALQRSLDSKIKIISPIIDLIEFKSGRGNVFLEGAVPLAKSLHKDIVDLGRRLEDAATESETYHPSQQKSESRKTELKKISGEIKDLLTRIDNDIPLLQLAVTGSGESMSTSLPPGVSPSRLLQASTFLIVGDTQFAADPSRPVQIGPSFTLSLYMLFRSHYDAEGNQTNGNVDALPKTPTRHSIASDQSQHTPYGVETGERKPMWQEILHKARVRLCRAPSGYVFDAQRGYHAPAVSPNGNPSVTTGWEVAECGRPDIYSYFFEIVEDLDDGRVHDAGERPPVMSFQDVEQAGMREAIPVYQIAKIFYTDTGRILNMGDDSDSLDNNPVLLIKRDVSTKPPKNRTDILAVNMSHDTPSPDHSGDEDDILQDEINRQIRAESEIPSSPPRAQPPLHVPWDLPAHLDPEWLAFEVFADAEEEEDDDDDEDLDSEEPSPTVDSSLIQEPSRPAAPATPVRIRPALAAYNQNQPRSSLDSRLIEQIRNISVHSPSSRRQRTSLSPGRTNLSPAKDTFSSPSRQRQHPEDPPAQDPASTEALYDSPGAFVSRSPFSAITSSLSLLEMLVRLTTLQAFQQTSHLSIPDHLLSFYLEESATATRGAGGMRGMDREEMWHARRDAKRRVGFDPYGDTPR